MPAARLLIRAARPVHSRILLGTRPFSASIRLAKEEGEGTEWRERDKMRTSGNEYSKTASDADSAKIEDTAFSRDKTKPEEQLKSADKESGSGENPLFGSPANHDLGKPGDPAEGGAESSSSQSGKGPSDRQRSSGPGETNKAGEGKKYDK